MHDQSKKQDRHTVIFLKNDEIVQVTGEDEGPHPVFYAVTGDYENLYINHDGIAPTPEQVANMISHETLHLVLNRLWEESPDEIEIMYMNEMVDVLNNIAFDYGIVEILQHSNGQSGYLPRLDNTGLPDNLEVISGYFQVKPVKADTSSYGMYG